VIFATGNGMLNQHHNLWLAASFSKASRSTMRIRCLLTSMIPFASIFAKLFDRVSLIVPNLKSSCDLLKSNSMSSQLITFLDCLSKRSSRCFAIRVGADFPRGLSNARENLFPSGLNEKFCYLFLPALSTIKKGVHKHP